MNKMLSFFKDGEMHQIKEFRKEGRYYYVKLPGQDKEIKINERICEEREVETKKRTHKFKKDEE